MSAAQDVEVELQKKRKRTTKVNGTPSTSSKRQKAANEETHGNGITDKSTTEQGPKPEVVENGQDQMSGISYEKRRKAEKRRKRKELEAKLGKPTEKPEDASDIALGDGKAVVTHSEPSHTRERQQRRLEKRRKRDAKGPKPKDNSALKWKISGLNAGRFIPHDPLYSEDEKYMFAATPRELQILSIETSLVERRIPAPKDSTISAFALSANDGERIHVASTSGLVQRWNWTTGEYVDEAFNLAGNITSLAVHSSSASEEDTTYSIHVLDSVWTIAENGRSVYTSTEPLKNVQIQNGYILASKPRALLIGKCVANLDDSAETSKWNFVDFGISTDVTCFAAKIQAIGATAKKGKQQATATLAVAVGSTSGEIFVYDDISSLVPTKSTSKSVAVSAPSPKIHHWHREAVASLKWSQDGNYLISGGKETVLVIWQMVTGKKQFLPHLTAEIASITVSPSGKFYATHLADNSIMALSTTELKPVANFAGLQASFPSLGSGQSQHGAALHPLRTTELYLSVPYGTLEPSHNGETRSRPFLQSYDTSSNRHIARQALSRNHVTDLNVGPEGNKLREPDVPFLQLSHDGEWLATVEEWEPPASDNEHVAVNRQTNEEEQRYRREVYLKIWQWNAQKAIWVLESRIDSPHPLADETKAGKILGLVSDPAEVGFATIGEDCSVRIWKPKTRLRNGLVVRGANSEGLVDWTCRHSVPLENDWSLAEPQNQSRSVSSPLQSSVAYSLDGSVLAVSQSTEDDESTTAPIHFIRTSTGSVVQSRSGLSVGPITSFGFLGRHLVILSTHSVSVWDVVTETESYTTEISTPDLNSSFSSRSPILSLSEDDNSIAIALPFDSDSGLTTRLRILNPENAKIRFEKDIPHHVTVVLSVKGRKGYTLLTADAEILHLSASTSIKRAFAQSVVAAVSEPSDDAIALVEQNEDQDMDTEDVINKEDARLVEDIDAEKPVVRPEELARVFEGAGAGALGVRDMFEAVVGLYGRRSKGMAVTSVEA